MSTDSATETPQCAHHWVIETANGPESTGECQKCHEVRGFKNSVESGGWGERGDAAHSTLFSKPPKPPKRIRSQDDDDDEEEST